MACSHDRCATFFTPCALQPRAFDGCDTVSCNSESRPKILLAPAAPLATIALASTARAFEHYDFAVGSALEFVQVESASTCNGRNDRNRHHGELGSSCR